MKTGFLNRLLDRAEKIDKNRIVDYLREIAEERDLMVLIFDSMIEGMIVIDGEEKVVFINQSARTILEMGDGPTNPDLSLSRVIDNRDLLKLCREERHKSSPLLFYEYEMELHDEKRFLQINIIPLDNQRTRFGTLILFTDETEHKKREQKLLEAEKLAALATLTAGMSHEIRNPLNSLSIHMQLLQRQLKKKDMIDEDIDNVLNIFSSEIQRLNDVIETFLSAVRPSKPEKKLIELYSIITETLTLMKPEFLEHEIHIYLHEEGHWPYINGDRNQIKQVFINLLRNAVEAISSEKQDKNQDKEREIVISMERENNQVRLIISDTGKGIEEKDISRVFEPYFTTKAQGTGLGLMIVERIIREHKGTIAVHSEAGIGTQFEIVFPVAAESPRLLKHEQQDVHADA